MRHFYMWPGEVEGWEENSLKNIRNYMKSLSHLYIGTNPESHARKIRSFVTPSSFYNGK